jgi:aspartate-semialdehyde dehydrogenase
MMELVIGLAGAVSLDAEAFLDALCARENKAWKVRDLRVFATRAHAGKRLYFGNEKVTVEELSHSRMAECDVVFLSSEVKMTCEKIDALTSAGVAVVHLSSLPNASRHPPCVLAETGGQALLEKRWLKDPRITLPSSLVSTVALALSPVSKQFGLKRVVVHGLISMSDKNRIGLDVLQDETQAFFAAQDLSCRPSAVLPRAIAFNVMPFEPAEGAEAHFSRELLEVLHLPKLKVEIVPIRVPVFVGHSASVVFETEKPASVEEISACLSEEPYLHVDAEGQGICSPRELLGKDRVRVTHIRDSAAFKDGKVFWVVADNLRRGIAESAVGLLGLLVRDGILESLRALQATKET